MVWCGCVAAISGFNIGWHIGVPNMPQAVITRCIDGTTSVGALPACLPMDEFTWGYTIGAFSIGGFFGSIASMYTNTWYSRRMNLLIAGAWLIAGGILSSCATNTIMYALGRALVGIGSGMSGASSAIYVSEISTNKSRGAMGTLFELFLNLGILLTQVCGMHLSTRSTWRLLWGIPSFIAALQCLLLYFTVVESPRRLCADKEYDKARVALQMLRQGAAIDDEFADLMASHQHTADHTPRMTIWDILSVKDRSVSWNTLIVVVLQAYNQICGIGPMVVYSVGFLTKVFQGDVALAIDVSLANAAGTVVSTVVALVLMHRVGRRGLMLISLVGTCLSSVLMVIGSTGDLQTLGPVVVAGAVIFTFTYTFGCGVIPWMIAPELLPMHALDAGSALGSGSNWIFNFIINTAWPFMNAGLGQYSFIVFVAINFVGFVFVALFMPETTGRSLDEKINSRTVSIVSSVMEDMDMEAKEMKTKKGGIIPP
ncbi:general substrate transporter [Spinellus fusiger]|nr:general substrate transporter [Spinellus fusiger]